MSDLAETLCKKLEALRQERSPYESTLQDIRELVRPNSPDFNRSTTPEGDRMRGVFDGTAVDCAEQFASGLYSFEVNDMERWFSLRLMDEDELQDEESLEWLEHVADRIFKEYSKPEVNFKSAIHECFSDLGPFGNAILHQQLSNSRKHVRFRADPFSNVYYQETNEGVVDTVFRVISYSSHALEQAFGQLPEKLAKKVAADKNKTQMFKVVHAVYPREGGSYGAIAKKKLFASCWVCEETKELISEGGYDAQPYHVTRWAKIAGETYGRGPGHKAIIDVRVLNRLERTILQGLQKLVDPPMVAVSESLLEPLQSGAGTVTMVEPGYELPQAIKFPGDLRLGVEFSEAKREACRRAFHVDWLRMEKTDVEMTATEVLDRRDEKLRMMAPMLARQQTELLGPMIGRTYQLLAELRQFRPPPRYLQGKRLLVAYTSQAAIAQLGSRATSAMRFSQEVVPLLQLKPDLMDGIDMDKLFQDLATGRGVPRTLLRTVDEINQIRQGRAQQQQMAQAAEIAEPASKAMKNVAEAQQLAPTGFLP